MELSRGHGSLSTADLRCVVDGAAPGAWNMAVDEALMESGRTGRVTLRLYGWDPGCLSFGRNQAARGRYDGGRAAKRGIDVVRRPTGGRSVFHYRELTYSVTAPADAWGGLADAYLRINRALASGLRALGVPASVAGVKRDGPIPRPTARACFRDPLPGEVMAGGRKLIGSAQWRDGGALLQHGSILLHNDQGTVEDLRVGGSKTADVPAVGLAEYVDPLPSLERLSRALMESFGGELEREPAREALTTKERSAAERALAKYKDDAWTWRR
ncbi:MAG: lipoate--protein ligase family protein [Gemmatimonadetes bacterium]|nr:lipoate--protein ligase family protein [Gemmatimonadota bacterium]NNK49874.1 lipoate--protein ligase family protein [Gemmatimonadota bacterium]